MNSHLSQSTELPSGITLGQITHFAASAVILNDQRQMLMMLRDDYPVWTTIGGMVEAGETFQEALHREIKEETHLSVHIERMGGDYFSPISNKNPLCFRHERIFVCRPSDPETAAILGDEGVCLQWMDLDKLPLNIPPKYRRRIEETIENILKKTSLLTLPHTSDFIQTLGSADIYGLEKWRVHPRVQGRRKAGRLANEVKRYFEGG